MIDTSYEIRLSKLNTRLFLVDKKIALVHQSTSSLHTHTNPAPISALWKPGYHLFLASRLCEQSPLKYGVVGPPSCWADVGVRKPIDSTQRGPGY